MCTDNIPSETAISKFLKGEIRGSDYSIDGILGGKSMFMHIAHHHVTLKYTYLTKSVPFYSFDTMSEIKKKKKLILTCPFKLAFILKNNKIECSHKTFLTNKIKCLINGGTNR